jgi:dTDP-4-amino-4,6-dideoxygalactose transaminase
VDLGVSQLMQRIAQAQDMAAIVERRRRNYFYLLGALRAQSPPLFSQLSPGVCPLFYPLLVKEKAQVMARLCQRGVHTVDFWSEGHRACDLGEFPEVAQLRRTVVEVPCHQDLGPEAMSFVADAVKEALEA